MARSNGLKAKVFSSLQTLGPSLTMGIAVIPLGGLLLGLSSIFTNTTFTNAAPFLQSAVVVAFATLLNNIGNLIISNLPVIFCISVATSYCKKDGTAAFSAILGFLTMHTTIGQILNITAESAAADWTRYTTMLGIPTLNMGVLGGMLCGAVTVFCYNHFKDVKLPRVFSFFQGKRFVPMVTIVASAVVALPASFVWPFIQNIISALADSATGSSPLTMIVLSVSTWLLIPFGLHTFLYAIWAYQLGTYITASGDVVHGFLSIFLAQITDGVPLTTYIPLTANYLYITILIGIALAIIKEAEKEKREETKSLFMGGIITGLATGISEPLFFPWVFSAPILYVLGIAILFCGEWLTYFLNCAVGISYCGGVVDFLIYGIMLNAHNWFLVPVICLLLGFVAFALSRLMIRRLHLNVPGQEGFNVIEDDEPQTRAEVVLDEKDSLEKNIITALGGLKNIEEIDACATRLRVIVGNPDIVSKKSLTALGASGVMAMGNNFQIVFGTQAVLICEQIKLIMQGKEIEGTKLEKKNEEKVADEKIVSPLQGTIMELSKVPDKVFSEGMMGCGFAVEPSDGTVVSPVNGRIDSIFPTKHAIGIVSEGGKEILIHLGVDTVKLEGEPFDIFVKENDMVKAGQPICKADLQRIIEKGYSTISPVIFTNMSCYDVSVDKAGRINKGEKGIIHFVQKNS